MLKVFADREHPAISTSVPGAQPSPPHPAGGVIPTSSPKSLVDLSRNASVISTSSSSSTSSIPAQLIRPFRPPRPFSAPRRSKSRDPHSPGTVTPRASSRPPAFLTKDLVVEDNSIEEEGQVQRLLLPPSRRPSINRSRQNSLAGKTSADDFTFDTRNSLGEGSYSEVLRGTHNLTQKTYAVKIVDKKLLMRENKVATAHAEKNALTKLGGLRSHPGIIKLQWTFQDDWSLYFVLDLAPNGDLQSRISRLGSLNVECTRFYMAQTIDAVQWMHNKGVLHRDLKPENILLDSDMRVKITDFGTSKSFDGSNNGFRATTWVGTAQYIAPELILSTYTCKSSDIWAIGCMIFQCIFGRFPFVDRSQYLMWEKVKKLDYEFPAGFDKEARDLVSKILVLDPQQRLGAGDAGSSLSPEALRNHAFFAPVDWVGLWTCPVPELAPGLYIRPTMLGSDGNEYDPGAVWDAFATSDGIQWLEEAQHQTPEFILAPTHPDEIAPHQVVLNSEHVSINGNGYAAPQRLEDFKFGETGKASPRRERADSTSHRPSNGSISIESHSGSGSSSSGHGSSSADTSEPTDLAKDLTALALNTWFNRIVPDEIPILTTDVESRVGLRQRASSIIPSVIPAVAPRHSHKKKKLLLTSERLLCLKVKEHQTPTIKTEIVFDTKGIMVDRKGDRDFVVQCANKAYPFTVGDAALASRWVQQLNDALDSHRGRRGRRT